MLKVKLSRHCKLALAVILAFGVSCKSKSSGGSSPAPDTTQQNQKQLQNGSLTPSITLSGMSTGSTVQIANRELDAIGGVPVVVTGIDVNNMIVGLMNAPTEVTLLGQAGQYRLGGRLPVGVLTAQDVVILARDRSKCQAADCGVIPDASGRFAQGQVVANPTYDIQGQFKVQLSAPATTTDSGTSGIGNVLSNGASFFQNLFSNPLGSAQSGASSIYDFFKNLFT